MGSKIAEMQAISAYAGSRKDFAQGGGGNTSVKVDDSRMVVKASGYLLNDVTEESGYAWVDYKKVREYYKQGCLGNVMDAWLKENEESALPSIEMTFHSVLGNYVIHTHSVYVNVLTCSEQGRAEAERIFGNEILWVPYQMPGDSITKEIIAVLDEQGRRVEDNKPIVIFMDNHGLIVSANSAEQAIKEHERINQILVEEFGIAKFPSAEVVQNKEKQIFTVDLNITEDTYFQKLSQCSDKNSAIFPDQVVYTHGTVKHYCYDNGCLILNAGIREANALFETLSSYDYIMSTIAQRGYDVRYLKESEVDLVLNNEQEKYRKEVIKKNYG